MRKEADPQRISVHMPGNVNEAFTARCRRAQVAKQAEQAGAAASKRGQTVANRLMRDLLFGRAAPLRLRDPRATQMATDHITLYMSRGEAQMFKQRYDQLVEELPTHGTSSKSGLVIRILRGEDPVLAVA